MIKQLVENSTFISSLSIIIPLIVGLVRFRKLSPTQKLLSYLVIASALTEIIANILWYQQLRNLEVYNVYALINFNLLAIILSRHLYLTWRKPLKLFLICFNGYFIIDALFFKDLKHWEYNFNSNLTTSASIILIVLALSYFHKLLKEVRYQKLERNSQFWISSGIVMYYSGTLILFLLGNQVNDPEYSYYYELHFAAWGLNSFFNLVLNTTYTIALWVNPIK